MKGGYTNKRKEREDSRDVEKWRRSKEGGVML
jgi:hypothetical protein